VPHGLETGVGIAPPPRDHPGYQSPSRKSVRGIHHECLLSREAIASDRRAEQWNSAEAMARLIEGSEPGAFPRIGARGA
jgi:hypothetical protein